MADVTVVVPEDAVMDCVIQPGSPTAEIKWLKDGKPIPSDRRFKQSYERNTAELRIKESKPEDAGKYKCVAHNIIGTAETSGYLVVNSKFLSAQTKCNKFICFAAGPPYQWAKDHSRSVLTDEQMWDF
jgi:hypothetical protein